jgi:ribonucleoside-diphosphate reductase alpha chain
VLDRPELSNMGNDDWDDVPTGLEYANKTPELSAVRVRATQPSLNGGSATQPSKAQRTSTGANVLSEHLKGMQSDAPACNTCGHITVRSGTCYKCLNCGNSMGCS